MTEQLEYVFFDEDLAKRFADFCQKHGVNGSIVNEELHPGEVSYSVRLIEEGLAAEVVESIEETYNDLFFGEQAAQIEGNDGDGALADACGVQVQLQSGEFTTVAIHPQIMNKILSVLTVDELQSFLSQVAEDIENPKNGPICRREDLPQL
ncbi:hypothetical protein [Thiomicrorhabdus chilensis]|uniref:hypothetical protein n=1 Tax=Thiomicrorhabdus chilensis TaxID=63656 RepID=UPI000400AF10|nr:hypothetical protein [Thiomicrorhabdus chilensis]